jgi:hypothetical protein
MKWRQDPTTTLSKDFQKREYAKLTRAHLQKHGASVESIRELVVCGPWPKIHRRPCHPPTLDLQALIQQAQDESNKPPPTIRGLQDAAESITADPFDPTSAFGESPMIEDKYKKWC